MNTARSSTGAVPPPCGRALNLGINGSANTPVSCGRGSTTGSAHNWVKPSGRDRSGRSTGGGVEVDQRFFESAGECGGILGLVDPHVVEAWQSRKAALPDSVDLAHVDDRSATLITDCRAAAGGEAREAVIGHCLGALAAATDFRIRVLRLRSN
ncbi:hypothetical protein GCM10027184_52240 [Saccharothrix stipae]